MEIKFIGNGSAFSKTNNNAFFEVNNDLIMIDCSMLNMNKIKEIFEFEKYKSINIFITHMHADHVCGIPSLIQYLFYIKNIITNIIVPEDIKNNIKSFLDLTGVNEEDYKIITTNNKEMSYLVDVIKTEHTNDLSCFGYVFNINNNICVYTGDTKTLKPFEKYINDCDEAYIDTSYNYNDVHINWNMLKNNLPNSKHIYLMHIDDERLIKECESFTNVDVVSIYK